MDNQYTCQITTWAAFFYRNELHRVPARVWLGTKREYVHGAPILFLYTYTTYVHKFMVNSAGIDKQTASLVNASTLFVYMLMQPLVGALSDRVGRRPILIAFGVLGTLLTVPILSSLQQVDSGMQAFWLVLGALAIVSGYTSINAVVRPNCSRPASAPSVSGCPTRSSWDWVPACSTSCRISDWRSEFYLRH